MFNPSLRNWRISHHGFTSLSVLWCSHLTFPLFCSISHSLLFHFSPCLLRLRPHPRTAWALVYEKRVLVSHPGNWTKTRTYTEKHLQATSDCSIASSSSLQPWWILPNSIVFSPPPIASPVFSSRNWVTVHRYEIYAPSQTWASTLYTRVKIQFISLISASIHTFSKPEESSLFLCPLVLTVCLK